MDTDTIEMYRSTVVASKDDEKNKRIYDGWIQFALDNILHKGDKICCSLKVCFE
jgi:hypothetical protein